MEKEINVLIPNATGPTNVGDQVILYSLLELLRKNNARQIFTILTTDPGLYKKVDDLIVDENLYEWSMSDSLDFITKLSRSVQVFGSYFLLKLKVGFLIKNKDLLRIINYYKNADLIVYVGGGSLRTSKGIKNSYVFFTLLIIYLFANLYKTKKIVTPISFGPFYYNWQSKIAAKIIEKSDIISFREIYSCNAFKKYSNKKFFKSSDVALYLQNKKIRKSKTNFIIGFTIMNLFNKKEQEYLEKSYTLALYKLAQQLTIKVQPIVQVNMPNIPQHYDLKATKRVVNDLKKYKVKTNKEIIITDIDSAIKTYGGTNLLLGMRMHSNIIAATQGVPFVAVAYEYKTEGIAREIGVENYCIRADKVNEKNLFNLLVKAYTNRDKLHKKIENSLKKIREIETQKWNKIFQSYLYI